MKEETLHYDQRDILHQSLEKRVLLPDLVIGIFRVPPLHKGVICVCFEKFGKDLQVKPDEEGDQRLPVGVLLDKHGSLLGQVC